MLRWSASFDIPTSLTNLGPFWCERALVVPMGNDVLVALGLTHGTNHKTELFVFRTEIGQFQPVEHHPLLNQNFATINVHNNVAYIWTSFVGLIPLFNSRKVYKLDLQTLRMELFLEVENVRNNCAIDCYRSFGRIAIVGGKMHVLMTDDKIKTMNLRTKRREPDYTFEDANALREGYESFILVHNRRLYLLQVGIHNRALYLMESRKTTLLCKDKYREDPKDFFLPCSGCHSCNLSMMKHDCTAVDLFDFNKNEWTRRKIQGDTFGDYIQSHAMVNNTIYAITMAPDRKMCHLRVLEMAPKLSTICMLKIVDLLIEDHPEEIVHTRTLLNLPLRKKYDSMMIWRIKEKIREEDNLAKLTEQPIQQPIQQTTLGFMHYRN